MQARKVFTVDGLRCKAEPTQDGWIVSVTGVTVAKHKNLARAIEEATGGIAGERRAQAIASELLATDARPSTIRAASRDGRVTPAHR